MSVKIIRKRKAFKHKHWNVVTVPNVLTFARICVIPFLVCSFFFNECITLTIFILASVTDYMDGYIAKKFKQISRFGAFLDPIADKLLIATTLFMIAGTKKIEGINLIPAVVVLCREFIISGLREFLATSGNELCVISIAKYKTTLQMVSITCLLANWFIYVRYVGVCLLWISALLATISSVVYIKACLNK
ncbi:MAG: CDP-diacylglycerol--glycerol-3-phosphate 3-phosphatidyltransferase [Holosporales bacterium]|jgi:CDP-diacylglycerol--glycerol-3-phosphate 3-phosphatidyltransferase|nr:CDP-diacylglycerol--glycerol-3-phosphate 3-phosphatidyltransferase [Holosporales bacterium]